MFINAVDNVICSQVAEQPDKYLVPHPSDCTKYYSCQNNGRRGGWIAYLMDCPATTGFDKKLRVCNDIKALPRCSKGNRIHQQNQNDGPFITSSISPNLYHNGMLHLFSQYFSLQVQKRLL